MRSAAGFTLIELVVVVTIIGILTGIALPNYIRSVEVTKADSAVAMVKMVGTVNRMYAMDNGGTYAVGVVNSACNNETACPKLPASDPCNLVSCKYLSKDSWDTMPYIMQAGNGAVASSICGLSSQKWVACAERREGPNPGTDKTPYKDWAYGLLDTGKVEPGSAQDTPNPLGL